MSVVIARLSWPACPGVVIPTDIGPAPAEKPPPSLSLESDASTLYESERRSLNGVPGGPRTKTCTVPAVEVYRSGGTPPVKLACEYAQAADVVMLADWSPTEPEIAYVPT